MSRKPKAKQLSFSLKQKIGIYKERNPRASIRFIAELFGVTYNQARRAITQWQRGELRKTKPRTKLKKIEEIRAELTPDETLERQFHFAVAQLESTANLAADERIRLLESLFSMRKILQNIRLESHIKRTDAGVIKEIVRKYEPNASDDDVIKIYLEAVERWKLQAN